jgi:hypothetical protein
MMTTKKQQQHHHQRPLIRRGNSDKKKRIPSLSDSYSTSYDFIRLFNMMIMGLGLFAAGAVLSNQLTFNKRVDDDESIKSTGSMTITPTTSATKMSRSLSTPPAILPPNCDVMEVYVQAIPGPNGDGIIKLYNDV